MTIAFRLDRPIAGRSDHELPVLCDINGQEGSLNDLWNHLQRPNDAQEFLEVPKLSISVLGKRQIVIFRDENTTIFSLEDVAKKIYALSCLCPAGVNILRTDRDTGRRIAHILSHVYRETDSLVAQSNWFTRLLVFLREFKFFSPQTRTYFDPHTNVAGDNFLTYTTKAYAESFGRERCKDDQGHFQEGVWKIDEIQLRKLVFGRIGVGAQASI